jgi:hypothetical protein
MNVAAADNLGLTRLLSFFNWSPASSEPSDAAHRAVTRPPHHFDRFADEILAASSVADLRERLEIVASDPAFWAHPPPSQLEIDRAERANFKLDMDVVRQTLGEAPTQTFCRGWEAMASFARVVMPALRQAAALPGQAPGMTEVLYDTDAPLEMRRAILSLSMAAVGTVAIFRASAFGKRLEPWLALALAEHVATGTERFLAGLVAAAQGSVQAAHSDHLDAWHQKAIASGGDVYFPVGDPDVSG